MNRLQIFVLNILKIFFKKNIQHLRSFPLHNSSNNVVFLPIKLYLSLWLEIYLKIMMKNLNEANF